MTIDLFNVMQWELILTSLLAEDQLTSFELFLGFQQLFNQTCFNIAGLEHALYFLVKVTVSRASRRESHFFTPCDRLEGNLSKFDHFELHWNDHSLPCRFFPCTGLARMPKPGETRPYIPFFWAITSTLVPNAIDLVRSVYRKQFCGNCCRARD